jgi:hypothetical protein
VFRLDLDHRPDVLLHCLGDLLRGASGDGPSDGDVVGLDPVAAATTRLAAGVPLGEVARRMGHSVDTLVSTYVGALTGDEDLANRRIDALLAGEQRWPR